MVLKWLGLGLVAGSATLLSAEGVMRAFSESKVIAPSALKTEKPPALEPTHVTVAAETPSEEERTPPAAKALPPVDVRRSRAAGPPLPPLPAPDARQSNSEPLQQLHAVRRALADHAPERALSLLDAFVARYPASSLLEEAAVLRIDALFAAARAEAPAAARNFLRLYPRSAYAERVRSQLSARP